MASNVKVVRDYKIEVFWFPSFQVVIKFVACVFVFFSFLQFWYMTIKFPACTKLWSNTDGQIKSFGQPWALSCLPGMGTFKFSQHRLCPILGSKNLDKMGLDKMRSDLSFSYEDILSYQDFSTRGLVLSWGARSQTGAQNPIVQGGLALHHSFLLFFSSYFPF